MVEQSWRSGRDGRQRSGHLVKQLLRHSARRWKLSEIDLQAQEYWDDFTEMKHRMLEQTSSSAAPWTIIRSNSKAKARVNAMKVILNAVDYADRDPDLDFTVDPEIVLSGKKELARMDEERDRLGRPRR